MEKKITGDEQVHPTVFSGFVYGDGSSEPPSITGGLTIRQHFAAMAMQGLLSGATKELEFTDIAIQSVNIADALIAELNK